MPELTDYDATRDSRTASVGLRSKPSSEAKSLSSSLSVTSQSSDLELGSGPPSAEHFARLPKPVASQSHPSTERAMSSLGFGNNRLATGFHKTRAILAEQAALVSASQPAPLSVASSPGASADDAIEISDDDSSSESGGMLLNVGNATILQHNDLMAIDDEGEAEEDRKSNHQESVVEQVASVQNATPTRLLEGDSSAHVLQAGAVDQHTPLRLADLSEPDLEMQFRYIFSYLKRDEIDLNCPAVCLGCLQEGHIQKLCPENVCIHCGIVGEHSSRLCPSISRCTKCRERGHTSGNCAAGIKVTTVPCDLCGLLGHIETSCPERFFPPSVRDVGVPVKIWVSCCHCASKSHYVGDCPDLDQNFATRWSMKSIDHNQITNLSLESNMRELEMEAENRGLRPHGLSIKGRAGLHHAGNSSARGTENDSSEDDFIRPKIEPSRRNHSGRHDFSFRSSERFPPLSSRHGDAGYDRYNAPSTQRGQRPRNDWYSTNSFGQRKSRSPSPGLSHSRRDDFDDPETFRRRSRSPRIFDGSRADRIRARSPRVRAPAASNTHNRRDDLEHPTHQPSADQQKGGISINLPMRRGSSNTNLSPSQAIEAVGTTKGRQDDSSSRGAGQVKSTKKKSKQTKAAAKSSQADDDSDYSPSATMLQPSIIANTDAGIVFPDRVPPKAILQKFVEAMNLHRQQIGCGHLHLRKRSNSGYFLIDNAKPVRQRLLELDKKRAAFIWQWSKTSLPQILKQTRLSKNTNGATAAAGTPFGHESTPAAPFTSENHVFLDLFGPTARADLLVLSEAHRNGTEPAEINDNHIIDGDSEGPANQAGLDPKLFFRHRGKYSLDNFRRRALRAEGQSPDVLEFTMYLDIFNAPRFDLGISPVFLRCEKGSFSYIDSAISDFNDRSIPVKSTHINELWSFFNASAAAQKKARLEVRSRLEALSHPVSRCLTRQVAEQILENIMSPESSTRSLPSCMGSTRVATRSQQAKLVGVDYDALEQAEKQLKHLQLLPEANSDDDA